MTSSGCYHRTQAEKPDCYNSIKVCIRRRDGSFTVDVVTYANVAIDHGRKDGRLSVAAVLGCPTFFASIPYPILHSAYLFGTRLVFSP